MPPFVRDVIMKWLTFEWQFYVYAVSAISVERFTSNLLGVVTRTQIIHILTINLWKKSRDGQLDAEEGRGVLLYPKKLPIPPIWCSFIPKKSPIPQSSLLNKLFPCQRIWCIGMSWNFLAPPFAHVWLFAWVVPNLRGFEGGRCLWKTAAWSQCVSTRLCSQYAGGTLGYSTAYYLHSTFVVQSVHHHLQH